MAMELLDIDIGKKTLDAVFRSCDEDGSGTLEFEEFARCLWPDMTMDLFIDDRKEGRQQFSQVISRRHLWVNHSRMDQTAGNVGVWNDAWEADHYIRGETPTLRDYNVSSVNYNIVTHGPKRPATPNRPDKVMGNVDLARTRRNERYERSFGSSALVPGMYHKRVLPEESGASVDYDVVSLRMTPRSKSLDARHIPIRMSSFTRKIVSPALAPRQIPGQPRMLY